MSSPLRFLGLCLAAAVALFAAGTTPAAETRDGVSIHLTHAPEDPPRVVMTLNMAAGEAASDLAPGVPLADKAKFFSFPLGRILSLDY